MDIFHPINKYRKVYVFEHNVNQMALNLWYVCPKNILNVIYFIEKIISNHFNAVIVFVVFCFHAFDGILRIAIYIQLQVAPQDVGLITLPESQPFQDVIPKNVQIFANVTFVFADGVDVQYQNYAYAYVPYFRCALLI